MGLTPISRISGGSDLWVEKMWDKCHDLETLLEEKIVSESRLRQEQLDLKRKYREVQKLLSKSRNESKVQLETIDKLQQSNKSLLLKWTQASGRRSQVNSVNRSLNHSKSNSFLVTEQALKLTVVKTPIFI
jgi:predicted nuclease with TOPRIM domain